ncbi:phosphatase [Hydrogenimonas sp. SS33]|uniref:Ppx/GppA phosphatase family protein n=1 Tax=Hydrogenimonas leucolamina TaxID=2954236 RepID=UPI00336BFD3B
MIAVDLGSNTFRAVEMACDTLEPAAEYEKIVRTADGLVETGKISDAAVERIVAAAREAKERLDFSQGVRAVTTEAIRRAANASEVLARIHERTGLRFETISGEEEARYTLLAVRTRLEKLSRESRRFLMVDIGGGSTEIAFFHEGRIATRSFPVGIVTLAQGYGTLEAIEAALPSLTAPMASYVEQMRAEGFRPRLFVPTAGTPTTVAAMKLGMTYATYDARRVNGTTLTPEELQRQFERLMSLDEAARTELVGVGREDLIAAGILIFRQLFAVTGFLEATVVDDGLREGVAIAACREMNGKQ